MSFDLSENIRLVLNDDDVVWPTTVSGAYRLITQRKGHNILDEGEQVVSESEMIDGVLNKGLATRWRSKTNPNRMASPNHFSVSSPSVSEAHVNVGGVWHRIK